MDYVRYAEIQNVTEGDDQAATTTPPSSPEPASGEAAPSYCTPL